MIIFRLNCDILRIQFYLKFAFIYYILFYRVKFQFGNPNQFPSHVINVIRAFRSWKENRI